jgi:urease accessory protein
VLKSLYPEGAKTCHNVLIHPPSGLVGGDRLDICIDMQQSAHALITTPGATRFYKSSSEWAIQEVSASLRDESKLEWIPLETLAYDGCMAKNSCNFDLKDSAQLIAWDITALGMPSSNLPFHSGKIEQHFELRDHWLDKGVIHANDSLLMDSPIGLGGKKCLSTLMYAHAQSMSDQIRESILELTRSVITQHEAPILVGATSPNAHTVVVRALSDLVEPSMDLLKKIWLAWRSELWGMAPTMPRIWAL